jgi:hypothetical protein
MKDEALRLALEALYGFIPYLPLEHDKPQCDRYDQAITAIEAALEAKDEPVACKECHLKDLVYDLLGELKVDNLKLSIRANRTWVGLTDEDKQKLAAEQHDWEGLCSAVEAKLKEKNT